MSDTSLPGLRSPVSAQQMTAEREAVVLVAETMAKYQRPRLFRRRRSPMEFVPIAREVVATLFLLPKGQDIVRRIELLPLDFDDHQGADQ